MCDAGHMSYETEPSTPTTLAPDEAFAALGNETRIPIVQTFGTPGDSSHRLHRFSYPDLWSG